MLPQLAGNITQQVLKRPHNKDIEELASILLKYFTLCWMIQLVLYYKDDSQCLYTQEQDLSFKDVLYRQFLKNDAYIMIASIAIFVIYQFVPKCFKQCPYCLCGICKSCVLITLFILIKLSLIIFGLMSFLYLQWSTCSSLLLDFSFVLFSSLFYFVTQFFLMIISTIGISLITRNLPKISLDTLPPAQKEQAEKIIKAEADKILQQRKLNQNQFHQAIAPSMKFFLYISWICNLILASKDNSTAIDLYVGSYVFTYRDWLKIDAFTTVGILFTLALITLCLCNQDCAKFLFIFYILSALFKLIWIITGIIQFLHLPFGQCSDILLQYSSAYFVGFLIVMGIIIQQSSKQAKESENIKQFTSKIFQKKFQDKKEGQPYLKDHQAVQDSSHHIEHHPEDTIPH